MKNYTWRRLSKVTRRRGGPKTLFFLSSAPPALLFGVISNFCYLQAINLTGMEYVAETELTLSGGESQNVRMG